MTRAKRILIALDQLVNAVAGGWPDETISSRAHRWDVNGKRAWPRRLIDVLFFFDPDHCRESYKSERIGRQLPAMTDAMQGAGWLWLGIVVWNKRSSRPQLGKFRQQCEYVLFGSKGRFVPAHRACFPGVFDVPVITQDKVHLTSKPVPLVRELLAITPPDALVLDPFLGGGTTAVAALETGRRCIGIELSEEYAAIAKDRCEKMRL